jgi:hypothetical protein
LAGRFSGRPFRKRTLPFYTLLSHKLLDVGALGLTSRRILETCRATRVREKVTLKGANY